MIIIINTPGRDDALEVNTNAGYLQQQHPAHQMRNITELADHHDDNVITDYATTLHIVAHGHPTDVGGQSPAELAKNIGAYINTLFQVHGVLINEIHLCACNTGRPWQDNPSFAEQFTDSLSTILDIPGAIKLSAPNGMLVYYPNGEYEVIKDEHPYLVNEEQMSALAAIDTTNIDAAKIQIKPHLAETPTSHFTAIPFSLFFDRHNDIAVIDDDDDDEYGSIYFTPHENINSANTTYHCYTNSRTYNHITNFFAAAETRRSINVEEKNESKLGFSIPIFK